MGIFKYTNFLKGGHLMVARYFLYQLPKSKSLGYFLVSLTRPDYSTMFQNILLFDTILTCLNVQYMRFVAHTHPLIHPTQCCNLIPKILPKCIKCVMPVSSLLYPLIFTSLSEFMKSFSNHVTLDFFIWSKDYNSIDFGYC